MSKDNTPNIKAMFFPGVPGSNSGNSRYGITDVPFTLVDNAKRANLFQSPVQLARILVDLQWWSDSAKESERPLAALPWRVMMQQMYLRMIDNGHIFSAMEKRKRLTLLKEFHICDENGETDEEATTLINKEWFRRGLGYILDARAYGFSLVSFGDMKNYEFPDISLVRRWNISPDRLIQSSYHYLLSGIKFNDPTAKDPKGVPYYDWNLWIPTPSDTGATSCGYGYLYKASQYGIILRNLLGWNTTFLEIFGMPMIVGRTVKSDEQRTAFEDAISKAGANRWIVTDPKGEGDDIELVESKGAGTGTGWKGYGDLEQRCNQHISKIILGHPDAIDQAKSNSLGGSKNKNSAGQGTSPAQIALDEIESDDSRFVAHIVNDHWIPKLMNLGLPLPLGKKFAFKDDLEQQQIRRNENSNNLEDAQVQLTISQAGGQPDWNTFNQRTGMNITQVETPDPVFPNNTVARKIKKSYGN